MKPNQTHFANHNMDQEHLHYGLQNGFDLVYEMLDETCDILSKKLMEKHS